MKMCLTVICSLQNSHNGGSIPPGKYEFVSRVCPSLIRLYFISSSRVWKVWNFLSPILLSRKCSLFSMLFLSKLSRSHLFWSHILPCSAICEFRSFATTGRPVSIAGASCFLLAMFACLSGSSFPAISQWDGI